MTWAQEGRERKAKDHAKSEEYAEAGIGKRPKRARKPFVVEWRYTPEGWEHLQTHHLWMLRWNKGNGWHVTGRYARKSDAQRAMETMQGREKLSKEYRLKEPLHG
ncbi:MAG: hypothetical protein WC100_01450 [Sterolibacterium sp.]